MTESESIELVSVGTRGCHALSVSNSSRLWRYYHDRYCVTLVTGGQAHWRYRNRDSEASVRGVMLMEPGEVHVNTSVEAPGSFFAVCIDPTHLKELMVDRGVRDMHFSAQFLQARSCIEKLCRLRSLCENDEPFAQEEQLCMALHDVLLRAGEGSLKSLGRASTPARRGAKILRDRYHADHWQTVDVRQVALELGLSYHWFVHSFKREFGLAPYQFVQALRREHARGLLARGPKEPIETMRDVAHAAGYADSSHMTREFRREYGLTPGAMAVRMNDAWSSPPKRGAWPACRAEHEVGREEIQTE